MNENREIGMLAFIQQTNIPHLPRVYTTFIDNKGKTKKEIKDDNNDFTLVQILDEINKMKTKKKKYFYCNYYNFDTNTFDVEAVRSSVIKSNKEGKYKGNKFSKIIEKTPDNPIYSVYSLYMNHSEFIAIDVDEDNIDNIDKFGYFMDCPWKRGNTKGIHIFVKMVNLPDWIKVGTDIWKDKKIVVDFIGGNGNNLWVSPSALVYNYRDSGDYPVYDWNECNQLFDLNSTGNDWRGGRKVERDSKKTVINHPIQSLSEILTIQKTKEKQTRSFGIIDDGTPINDDITVKIYDKNEIKDLIDQIDPGRAGPYETWSQVVHGIYNTWTDYKKKNIKFTIVERNELIHYWSQKDINGYDEERVNEYIENNVKERAEGDKKITIGTIIYLVNENKKKNIMKNNKVPKNNKAENHEIVEDAGIRDNAEDEENGDEDNEDKNENHIPENAKKYSELKKSFEKRNFKINNPISYGEINFCGELVVRNVDKFTVRYKELQYVKMVQLIDGSRQRKMCSFTTRWLKDENKRYYEEFKFNPTNRPMNPLIYNTFNGLEGEHLETEVNEHNLDDYLKNDEDYRIIDEHLSDLCGNSQKVKEYVWGYFAHIVQYRTQTKNAIVFQSEEGVGKDAYFKLLFRYVIGQKYTVSCRIEQVGAKFNSVLENKLCVIFNEVKSHKSFELSDEFKELIDGASSIVVEKKGFDAVIQDSNLKFILFSNNDNPVKIPKGDRRFVVIGCNNKWVNVSTEEKNEHFKPIIQICDYGNSIFDENKAKKVGKIIYLALKRYDLSKFNINNRPITENYLNMQRSQLSIIYNFLQHVVTQMSKNNEEKKIWSGSDFFNYFRNWKDKVGYASYDYNPNKFSREITKDFKCVKKIVVMTGTNYEINIEDIVKVLQEKGFIEKTTNTIEITETTYETTEIIEEIKETK